MGEKILNPNASSTIKALMCMGYDFKSAIADIVDNSIDAGATDVVIVPAWNSGNPYILIRDNGKGMSRSELDIAMSLGADVKTAQRSELSLGKFGYGLKSASFSQCRRLTVISRKNDNLSQLSWDVDEVERRDEWVVFEDKCSKAIDHARRELCENGTVVVWEEMYRLLDDLNDLPEQEDYFYSRIKELSQHLAVTYHKFIDEGIISITIGRRSKVKSWNPFKYAVKRYPTEQLHYPGGGEVQIRAFLLRHHKDLSPEQFKELEGTNWVYNQGVYVYRNKRLIEQLQWLGYKEPTKILNYIRIEVTINSAFDEQVNLDVKKMNVTLPNQVERELKGIIDNSLNEMKRVYYSKSRSPIREVKEVHYVWESRRTAEGMSTFHVNLEHPIIQRFVERYQIHKSEIKGILGLIERTFPYIEVRTSIVSQPALSEAYLESQLKNFYKHYKRLGIGLDQMIDIIRYIEPFNQDIEMTSMILQELEGGYKDER